MPHLTRAFVTVALLAELIPTRAYACSGPCTSPELWELATLGETPLVVTNFGLLSPLDGGWQLTCEEVIGGILLSVESNGSHAVVSSDVGLFMSNQGACGFKPGPTSERSSWLLDFAIAENSTTSSPQLLGLVSDSRTSVINVELAQGNTFEVLHNLGSETAYRHIEASPDFSTIVAAGYSSQPRRWQLAWSADRGQSWQEFTPDVGTSSASALLMGLDPNDPDRLFFQAQGTDETPASLWSYKRTSAFAERLFVLEEGQAITGLTFAGNELWLSSKGESGGGLYRAVLPALAEFEPVLENVPPLACLGIIGATPFVCADDYSAESPFLLAKVDVDNRRFEPMLDIGDLGRLTDCGASCASTQTWLRGVYGAGSDAGTDASDETSTSDPSTPPARGNGGCSISREADPPWRSVTFLLALFALLGCRRRRRVVP